MIEPWHELCGRLDLHDRRGRLLMHLAADVLATREADTGTFDAVVVAATDVDIGFRVHWSSTLADHHYVTMPDGTRHGAEPTGHDFLFLPYLLFPQRYPQAVARGGRAHLVQADRDLTAPLHGLHPACATACL